MRVPYSYLREQFADSEPILRDIKGLLESTRFTLGPPVAEFEERFARLCGARHAMGGQQFAQGRRQVAGVMAGLIQAPAAEQIAAAGKGHLADARRGFQ